MSYSLLIAGGVLALDWAYHRWIDPPEEAKRKPVEFKVATTSEGEPVPMIYGKVRVDRPILAWCGYPQALDAASAGGLAGDAPYLYGLDMFFVLGIPFYNGICRVTNVWAGGELLNFLDFDPPITGAGNFETGINVESDLVTDTGFIGGNLEFLDGRDTQVMVDTSTGTAYNEAARRMKLTSPGGVVPGYRGYLTALLYRDGVFDPLFGPSLSWSVGTSPQVSSMSFEVTSYPNTALHSKTINADGDANPADVIWDVLRSTFGKLGLPYTLVDYTTFRAAAEQLHVEGMGYSRVFDGRATAADVIFDVCRHIDAVVFIDHTLTSASNGLIKIKLIRPDFNPNDLQLINPNNCEDLEPVELSSRSGLVNRVRVKYRKRSEEYAERSATSDNLANVVGEDGEEYEEVIDFPGCTTEDQANVLAARELSATSKPIAKFRAKVDRSFYRITPGEAVAVTWPKYNINGAIFRVARVIPGYANQNHMTLELIQDFHYLHHFDISADSGGGLPSHAEEAVSE